MSDIKLDIASGYEEKYGVDPDEIMTLPDDEFSKAYLGDEEQINDENEFVQDKEDIEKTARILENTQDQLTGIKKEKADIIRKLESIDARLIAIKKDIEHANWLIATERKDYLKERELHGFIAEDEKERDLLQSERPKLEERLMQRTKEYTDLNREKSILLSILEQKRLDFEESYGVLRK